MNSLRQKSGGILGKLFFQAEEKYVKCVEQKQICKCIILNMFLEEKHGNIQLVMLLFFVGNVTKKYTE